MDARSIPADALRAAMAVLDSIPSGGPSGVVCVEDIARAIMAERERCARVADEIGAGRSRQSGAAKAAKRMVEARDFESMSMSAIEIGFEIRKGET